MRTYIIIMLAILTTTTYAQESKIEVRTNEGTFSVRISENEGNISATMLSVPENIHKRLMMDIRKLRKDYIINLRSRKDRKEAMALLDEIEDLINLLYNIGFSAQVSIQDTEGEDNIAVQEGPSPMSPERFSSLLSQLEDESFTDDKLNVLRSAVTTNYFTVNQLCAIMDKFDMDDDKVEAVRIVYPHVIDRENAHKLLSKVTFDKEKQEIREIIESNK